MWKWLVAFLFVSASALAQSGEKAMPPGVPLISLQKVGGNLAIHTPSYNGQEVNGPVDIVGFGPPAGHQAQFGITMFPRGNDYTGTPNPTPTVNVQYQLGGHYSSFTATFGITRASFCTWKPAIQFFTVLGDGNPLWHVSVTQKQEAVPVQLSIIGVEKLEISSSYKDSYFCADGIVGEPRVYRELLPYP